MKALGLPSLERRAAAEQQAEIGGVDAPTRPETVEFLVDTLLQALSRIPPSSAAWSWGEFCNAGIQPVDDIHRQGDFFRLAICAVDLGLVKSSVVV